MQITKILFHVHSWSMPTGQAHFLHLHFCAPCSTLEMSFSFSVFCVSESEFKAQPNPCLMREVGLIDPDHKYLPHWAPDALTISLPHFDTHQVLVNHEISENRDQVWIALHINWYSLDYCFFDPILTFLSEGFSCAGY